MCFIAFLTTLQFHLREPSIKDYFAPHLLPSSKQQRKNKQTSNFTCLRSILQFDTYLLFKLCHYLPTLLSLPTVNTRARRDERAKKKHNLLGDTQKYQLEERGNMGIFRVYVTLLTPGSIQSLPSPKVLAERAFLHLSFHAIPSFPDRSYAYLDCEGDVTDRTK